MVQMSRGLGEPLQVDELRGHNGYVDRFGSGLTRADVRRLYFKRTGMMSIVITGVISLMFSPMVLLDPLLGIILIAIMAVLLLFSFGIVFLLQFSSCGHFAKNLIENNYVLLLKDSLVVQSQSDMNHHILRNEVPLSKISSIVPVDRTYFEQCKARTSLCTRFTTGDLTLPIGGLHPFASRKENLAIIHLREPQEIHCIGRNHYGNYPIFQMGDKREYVKEMIISIDPPSLKRLLGHLGKYQQIDH